MVTRLTSYTKQRYVYNSTDDPGDIVFRNGDTAFLMDTQTEIIYSEENNQWYPVPAAGGGGGDPYTLARQILSGSIRSYIDDGDELTYLRTKVWVDAYLTVFQCHAIQTMGDYAFQNCRVTHLAFPNLTSTSRAFESTYLQAIDFGPSVSSLYNALFNGASSLKTVVLRRTSVVSMGNVNCFQNTPMKSGGSGIDIYIPKVLYDALGTGTNDYQAASNWSTYQGYGTITWHAIEGSIYETQYADGTAVGS